MKLSRMLFGAAVATLVAVPTVQAQTLTINPLTPTFLNDSPDNGVMLDNSPASDIRVCWPGGQGSTSDTGDCNSLTTGNQSGYRFQRVATPLNVNLSSGSALFKLGDFTHYNRPITGTSLLSVDLKIDMTIAGASPSIYSETFTINHDETDNDPETWWGANLPCKYAGSTSRCDDYVSFGTGGGSSSFSYLGVTYAIDLIGFSQDNGVTVTNGFLSPENGTNTAAMYARISRTSVPEPSSYALMSAGLLGIFAAARRRRQA